MYIYICGGGDHFWLVAVWSSCYLYNLVLVKSVPSQTSMHYNSQYTWRLQRLQRALFHQIGPEYLAADQDLVDFGKGGGKAPQEGPEKGCQARAAGPRGFQERRRRCVWRGWGVGLAPVRRVRGRVPQAGIHYQY